MMFALECDVVKLHQKSPWCDYSTSILENEPTILDCFPYISSFSILKILIIRSVNSAGYLHRFVEISIAQIWFLS